jgi:hypothetical protein
MMAKAGGRQGRQVLITTHSEELLTDPGIAPEEVLLLQPGKDGTEARLASLDADIQALCRAGLSMADAALPRTAPSDTAQLALMLD